MIRCGDEVIYNWGGLKMSRFSTLLLVLVASLGGVLSSQSCPVAIVHRPLVVFPQEPLLNAIFNGTFTLVHSQTSYFGKETQSVMYIL